MGLFFMLGSQNFDSLVFYSIKINSDTAKVNLFYAEGFEKRMKNPQYSYNCARQAEYFASHANSPRHIAKAYNLLGILFYKKGDLKTALGYHQKALQLRESIRDEKGIALSETNIGNILSDLQKTELAEISYLRALQLNSKLNDTKQCGNCYINLGVLKVSVKEMEAAEKYFYEAFKIAKTTVDYELEALALNNLSYINIHKGNYEIAISNCFDALKAKEIMENEFEKTDSYLNLAKAYFYLNDKNNYEYYLNRADSFCKAYDYTEARYELYRLKAEILEKEKRFEEALKMYKMSVVLKDSMEMDNKMLAAEYNFLEDRKADEEMRKPFQFPFFMLALILFGSIAIAYFIFKFKK